MFKKCSNQNFNIRSYFFVKLNFFLHRCLLLIVRLTASIYFISSKDKKKKAENKINIHFQTFIQEAFLILGLNVESDHGLQKEDHSETLSKDRLQRRPFYRHYKFLLRNAL